MEQQENIANMGPGTLLENYAEFKHYQMLGKCLAYDPEVKEAVTMKLSEWDYQSQDEETRQNLEKWAKGSTRSREFVERFISAGTNSFTRGSPSYRQILEEIEKKLKIQHSLARDSSKDLLEVEEQINTALLQKALENFQKLPPHERDEARNDMKEYLNKHFPEVAKNMGKTPPDKYLLACAGSAGMASAVAFISSGIILSNLGVWPALLLAFGLYTPPTALIGTIAFVPLMGGALVYNWGKHNFKKTIPFVTVIHAIRREARDQRALPDTGS